MTRLALRSALFLLLFAVFPAPAALGEERLDFEDLAGLLRNGVEQDTILRLVGGAGGIDLDPEEVDRLEELGAGEELLAVLRQRTGKARSELSVGRVLDLLAGGTPEAELIDRILAGGRRFALADADLLRLVRSGASKDLRLALQGRYVYPGYRLYRDPMHTFSVQYPEEWRAYEWYTGEGMKILLSPEGGVPGPDEFQVGLQIQLSFLPPEHPVKKVGLFEYHRRTLTALLRTNWKIELATIPGPSGEPEEIEIAGRPAVRQALAVYMKGTRCREALVRLVEEDVEYFIEFVAPVTKYFRNSEALERMLRTFRPFPDRDRPERLPAPLEPADVVDRHVDSVVLVKTEHGTGSGFFVREDGYVLTNHHVVCGHDDHSGCTDPGKMLLATDLQVISDRRVQPKRPGEQHRSSPALLVDTVYGVMPKVDLALLKVPPGPKPFEAIPLCPISSGLVQGADRITSLGFPRPDRYEIGNVFATEGIVSRINWIERRFGDREGTRRLDDVVTTAEIQPGNSGGPAVSLATGGVVGLNTWTHLTMGGQELDYFGLCAIDHALDHFPQIRWYPRDREFEVRERLEFASLLLTRGNLRVAEQELLLVMKEQEQLTPELIARLNHQSFLLCAATGHDEAGKQFLDLCLKADPDHTAALTVRAGQHAEEGRIPEAIAVMDRLVRQNPYYWWPHHQRAVVYHRAGRLEDALRDLEAARELGGEFDPSVHLLMGQIHLEQEQSDAAKECFLRAAAADPTDVTPRLWSARAFLVVDDLPGAMLEYGRILAEFPDEPAAHKAWGEHLQTQSGREPGALQSFLHALILRLDRGEVPTFDLLHRIGMLARGLPGAGRSSLLSGTLLHQHHPEFRHWSHNFLHDFWRTQGLLIEPASARESNGKVLELPQGNRYEILAEEGEEFLLDLDFGDGVQPGRVASSAVERMTSLGRAHYRASDVLYGANFGKHSTLADSYPARPLRLIEVLHLATVDYGPELFAEALAEASYDFSFGPDQVQVLQGNGWQPWRMSALLEGCLRDQLMSRPGLASLVTKTNAEPTVRLDGAAPTSRYRFENRAPFPIGGLSVRRIYMGEDQAELLRTEAPVEIGKPLAPGETRELEIAYDTWDALARQGVREEAVQFLRLDVVAARNALAVTLLELPVARATSVGYEIQVRNPGLLVLAKLHLLVRYPDEKRATVVLDLVVPPGGTSEVLQIPGAVHPPEILDAEFSRE